MDDYDLGRRTEVLVDRFLGGRLHGKLVLDAGCGVGGVTRALVARGARVIALDIGPKLAAEARARCGCPAVVGTLAATGFASNSFDVVLSSEAVEHTPDPRAAVRELYRLVQAGRRSRSVDAQSAVAGAGASRVVGWSTSVRRVRELSVAAAAAGRARAGGCRHH